MLLSMLLLAIIVLLALNAFFVLAEFAVIKIRPSRVLHLVSLGDQRAILVKHIQEHLDEYLGVCQLGITLASIALGMVGEQASELLMGESAAGSLRYGMAIFISYIIISGSHVLLGELVPKSIAIRLADQSALLSARPLLLFHKLFYPALWILTIISNRILKIFGIQLHAKDDQHNEDELRIILDQSQRKGILSFRRLLMIENIFDLSEMKVRDVMRQQSQVHSLDARETWETNLKVIRASQFTRYPLITSSSGHPTKFVHLKDVIVHDNSEGTDLRKIARPLIVIKEDLSLEAMLTKMQRNRIHVALVVDHNKNWVGFLTFEDILEELIGSIRDEFENEEHVRLTDALTIDRIIMNSLAESPTAAIHMALSATTLKELPLKPAEIMRIIEKRDNAEGIHLGNHFALIHARAEYRGKPMMLVIHLENEVRCRGTNETAKLLFLLITPIGHPRIHQRLKSILLDLLSESDYVKERLLLATSPEEILNIIATGEQTALD